MKIRGLVGQVLRGTLKGMAVCSLVALLGSCGGGGTSAPLAPSALVVGTITDTTISFSWTNNAADALLISMETCTGSGCTNFAAASQSPLAPTATAYSESGLTPGTIYRFRLSATSAAGQSDWLESGDIQTLLLPNTSITTTGITSSAISLGWVINDPTATRIDVQRCNGVGCTEFRDTFSSPLSPAATTYTEEGLTESSTYRFRVRAATDADVSDWLATADIATLPNAPTELVATPASTTSIGLTWTDNSASATGYQLQRCSGSACTDFADVAASPLAPDATAHTETGLTIATIYRFRLRAISAAANSEWLTSADVSTLPAPPSGLAASLVTNMSLRLNWVNGAPDAELLQLERCTGLGCTDFNELVELLPDTTQYDDSGLTANTYYSYRIRAHYDIEEIINSNSAWNTLSDVLTGPVIPVAKSCAAPTTVVVDSGLKEGVASVGRGLWSDTAIIPGTQTQAVAFYDGSTTGGNADIKISFWNGSDYTVEAVAGDAFVAAGSATWVKLAFLTVGANAGRPIVVWSTGSTTVKAAMRSAPLGETGTWSAQIVDTVAGAATRAASISVSPLDQVSVAYLTNSTAAGRTRFIYCNAGCSSLAGFTAMAGAADTVENTVQMTNMVGIDTAWCKYDATTFYPAVVYTGTPAALALRYAVCANADLSTCQTSAGWTASNIVAGPVTTVSVDAYIDSTIQQDTVKVLVKPAAGTALTTYTSTAGCDNPGAFTVGAATVGAATSGTAWSRLMKDGSGLWHAVANDALTSVVYMNSNSTNYQATTWNAAGTIESVTLPAVGSGAGGADVAKSEARIYASYGLNAAPYDINLGVVGNITIPSNNAAAIYYTEKPDLTGNIDIPLAAGNQVRNISAACISTGEPGVAYTDHSLGALANGWMKYAYRDGTQADSEWLFSDLPISNVASPILPSLAYDHDDRPWVSYFNSGTFRYSLATNSRTDGQGTWNVYQLPSVAKTAMATPPATDDTAVAMYYNGGIAYPVVIYMNSTATGTPGVRAVRFDPLTGHFGSPVTVDSLGGSYATRLTADYDTNGNIVIAYFDLTTNTVKFNYSTNGGTTWNPASAQITAAGVGREGLSVKLNPTNLHPAVSYYQRSANKVYYNTCSTTLSSCNIAGNWVQTEAQGATAVGVSGIAAPANEQVLNTSLTFSGAGVPYIAYMTGIAPTDPTVDVGLVLTDSTSGWTPVLPIPLATNTTSTNVAPGVGVAAMHFNQHGMNVSSVRNSLGQLINLYVGPNNWLYSTSCGD